MMRTLCLQKSEQQLQLQTKNKQWLFCHKIQWIFFFSVGLLVFKIITSTFQSEVPQTDGEINVVTLILYNKQIKKPWCNRALSSRTNKNCLCSLMLHSLNGTQKRNHMLLLGHLDWIQKILTS